MSGNESLLAIETTGLVETIDTAGVSGPHRGHAPLWLFESETALTKIGEQVSEVASSVSANDQLGQLHSLMSAIRERVAYKQGVTNAATSAEQALGAGEGVCQDHAHIFIACARSLRMPARYVSGYLMLDMAEQAASHAWAEVHVEDLGWVAFDVSNGISPDERYVRLAVGRDYRDAMPISGIRTGDGAEQLAVQIMVEQ